MAIQLEVADYCQNCNEFEPEAQKESIHCWDPMGNDAYDITNTIVHCEHRTRCKSLYNFIQRQKERG